MRAFCFNLSVLCFTEFDVLIDSVDSVLVLFMVSFLCFCKYCEINVNVVVFIRVDKKKQKNIVPVVLGVFGVIRGIKLIKMAQKYR